MCCLFRAYFRCSDEMCTCWMRFRNPVHDRNCFLLFCNFKSQMFSAFFIFIYYLITTVIKFAVSVFSMFNKAYFIKYHFNISPFTYKNKIVGCFINRNNNKLPLACFKTNYDVNLFQNRIAFRWFSSSFKL